MACQPTLVGIPPELRLKIFKEVSQSECEAMKSTKMGEVYDLDDDVWGMIPQRIDGGVLLKYPLGGDCFGRSSAYRHVFKATHPLLFMPEFAAEPAETYKVILQVANIYCQYWYMDKNPNKYCENMLPATVRNCVTRIKLRARNLLETYTEKCFHDLSKSLSKT